MADSPEYSYKADTSKALGKEIVTAIAKAHDEDVIEQKWRISDDIDTDSLDGLFQDNNLDTTLQFDADTTTVTIIANKNGNPIVEIESHR